MGTVRMEVVDHRGVVHDAAGWAHDAYMVRLRFEGRQLTVPFRAGVAFGAVTAADVLECLLSDAAGYESADADFDAWASEYGYSDDAEARETFGAVERQTLKLRRLLGDAYQDAVFPPYDDDDNDPTRSAALRLAGQEVDG